MTEEKTNKYQIIFWDDRTGQQYQVGIEVTGELKQTDVYRNTLVMLGGGKMPNIKINRLEKTVSEKPVEIKLEKNSK